MTQVMGATPVLGMRDSLHPVANTRDETGGNE